MRNYIPSLLSSIYTLTHNHLLDVDIELVFFILIFAIVGMSSYCKFVQILIPVLVFYRLSGGPEVDTVFARIPFDGKVLLSR